MSKYLSLLVAVVFISLISLIPASIVFAQDSDYEGIEVPEEETPVIVEETPPVSENESYIQFVEKVTAVKNDELTKFQLARERRLGIITANQANVAAGTPNTDVTMDYRLASILVSARYHKTLEAYANYLLLIEQSITPAAVGVGSAAREVQLNAIHDDIVATSSLVSEMDFTLDNVTGTSDADLANLTADMSAQSETIKIQLEGIRVDMLDLVESIK